MQIPKLRGIIPSGNEHVVDSMVSRGCRYLASTLGDDSTLALNEVASGKRIRGYEIARTRGFAFRSFLRESGEQGTELIVCQRDHDGLLRFDIEHDCVRPKLETQRVSSAVAYIQESSDGRYLAIMHSDGMLQVWNLDTPEPMLITCLNLRLKGTVSAVSFNRSNMLLCVTTNGGGVYIVDVWKEMVLDLHHEKKRCPIYTVAWHPNCNGLVFGGRDRFLWFLNMPSDKGIAFEFSQVPLHLGNARRINSNGFLGGTGERTPVVNCFQTWVGKWVSQVVFLDPQTIAVRGQLGVEAWSIETGERVAEFVHGPDVRNFDVQAGNGEAWFSVER